MDTDIVKNKFIKRLLYIFLGNSYDKNFLNLIQILIIQVN